MPGTTWAFIDLPLAQSTGFHNYLRVLLQPLKLSFWVTKRHMVVLGMSTSWASPFLANDLCLLNGPPRRTERTPPAWPTCVSHTLISFGGALLEGVVHYLTRSKIFHWHVSYVPEWLNRQLGTLSSSLSSVGHGGKKNPAYFCAQLLSRHKSSSHLISQISQPQREIYFGWEIRKCLF